MTPRTAGGQTREKLPVEILVRGGGLLVALFDTLTAAQDDSLNRPVEAVQ